MNLVIVIGVSLLFGVLFTLAVVAIAKGIRSGKIRPATAKLLGLAVAVVGMGLFVLLMGLIKTLQNM